MRAWMHSWNWAWWAVVFGAWLFCVAMVGYFAVEAALRERSGHRHPRRPAH
jgi:hypothetical protein